MPSLSFIYRFLTTLFAPLIALYLRVRCSHGKEDEARFRERLGFAGIARPTGRLVWCHAASVGEALSVLSLLIKIHETYPNLSLLLTTGTVTSARLMQERLPPGIIHQFMPVDRWPYVTRFLEHWRPDLVLWMESELWPNMIGALLERHVPAILLNGRMSDRSYQRWRMLRASIKRLLSVFVLGLAQTGAERNRFAALGLENVQAIGNLKFAADPLPCNDDLLAAMKEKLSERPVWVMASTHTGEDEIALKAHHHLAKPLPDLLTIIVPRHPVRGSAIADLAAQSGLRVALRSAHEELTAQTQIYIADTMGELGLFYRLTPVCCLAGSFAWGGHNPVEPALLGCAVVFGPRMDNFALMADDMMAAAAALQVSDEDELVTTLQELLADPARVAALSERAQRWATDKHQVLDRTLELLDPYLRGAS